MLITMDEDLERNIAWCLKPYDVRLYVRLNYRIELIPSFFLIFDIVITDVFQSKHAQLSDYPFPGMVPPAKNIVLTGNFISHRAALDIVVVTGVADVLLKPFPTMELLMRVLGHTKIEVHEHKVAHTNLSVLRGALNTIEEGMFDYLLSNYCRPVSRSMILQVIWRFPNDGVSNRLLDVHLEPLIQRLAKGQLFTVIDVNGVGFKLV